VDSLISKYYVSEDAFFMVATMRNSNVTEVDWMCIIRYNAFLQYFISYHLNARIKVYPCLFPFWHGIYADLFFSERPSSKQCSGRCP